MSTPDNPTRVTTTSDYLDDARTSSGVVTLDEARQMTAAGAAWTEPAAGSGYESHAMVYAAGAAVPKAPQDVVDDLQEIAAVQNLLREIESRAGTATTEAAALGNRARLARELLDEIGGAMHDRRLTFAAATRHLAEGRPLL